MPQKLGLGNVRTGAEVIGSSASVVVVEQYDEVSARGRSKAKQAQSGANSAVAGMPSGPGSAVYQISSTSTAMCSKWLWECGRAAKPPCKLRHAALYRLRAVREPVNSELCDASAGGEVRHAGWREAAGIKEACSAASGQGGGWGSRHWGEGVR